MATLASNALTLGDWAKRRDPDDRVATIIELLSQSNPILEDMLWTEGNLPTGHRTTVRTGLPDVAWRKLNYGVPQSKSTTVQVDDTCGMLEAFGQVDKDLAELNGNTAAFRLTENMAFLESMNQELASTLIYGNSGTEPEAFTGLAPRYSSLSASSGQNILSAGGAATNTSIWLAGWGDQALTGIYPKGSTAGLQHVDLGLDTITVSVQTHPPQRFGLARIAQIRKMNFGTVPGAAVKAVALDTHGLRFTTRVGGGEMARMFWIGDIDELRPKMPTGDGHQVSLNRNPAG